MRLITDTLRDLRHGLVVDEASEKLQELVKAVSDTNKAGELTIKIKVKPAARIAGTFLITDTITVKKPELPAGETLLYGTPEGNLVTQDPAQHKLDLKPVAESKPSELKQVNA